MASTEQGPNRGAISFHRPVAFWLGAAALTVGVILHLPMYLGARDMGYRLAGMAVDGPMMAGMGLIMVGLAAPSTACYPACPACGRRRRACG